MSGDLHIGVDIGGTFTDVVVRRPGSPSRIMKIPTTRSDPSIAVLEALKRMQAEWGLAPHEVARFVHGTTVATNAVLERKGACVGDHHRGIPRRARDRAADAPPDVRTGARPGDADLSGAGAHAARSAG